MQNSNPKLFLGLILGVLLGAGGLHPLAAPTSGLVQPAATSTRLPSHQAQRALARVPCTKRAPLKDSGKSPIQRPGVFARPASPTRTLTPDYS